MFGLAIAAVFGSPIVILAVGFIGVSQKRAEDSRAHIIAPSSAAKKTAVQSVQKTAQPA